MSTKHWNDPIARLAEQQREFGEHGGVNPSIEISTTFTVLDAKTLPDIFTGNKGPGKKQGGCYLYGRSFSPTLTTLGKQLAALEDTQAAYPVSSGMAAISSSILGCCDSGDHVVCSNVVYGGTYAFMKSYLPQKCGIRVTFVDITDLAAVEAAFTDRTKVLYTEVLSNPTLVVADLPNLAAIAHDRPNPAALVVDNTFTPLSVTPAHHGADVVIHSITKFISGASDIIAGAVCGSKDFLVKLFHLHTGPLMLQGPTMDPRTAAELLLRLPHLPLRVTEHSKRAAATAEMLQTMGAKVVYPGLPTHPGHELLKRMLNPGYGFGGLLGVDMGSPLKAEALMERLQNKHGYGFMAVSLGYADTLMSLSAASTSSEMSEADKAKADISDGYVRMSIGITGTLEQRLSQLKEAYQFVAAWGGVPPYRATKVQRQANGHIMELLSWPSEGPEEDGAAAEQECTTPHAAHLAAPKTAAAVFAAAAEAEPCCRMVLGHHSTTAGGGGGVPVQDYVGGLLVATEGYPAVAAAAAQHTVTAATDSAVSGGSMVAAADGVVTSDEEEQQRQYTPGIMEPGHAGVNMHKPSRLGGGGDSSCRPVKIRKLDDDTHIVYTPLT